MAKLNPTTMKTQYDGQYDTFCRKNHDYGNSFEESLDKFGIIASLVRMQDKMLRLESLTDDSKTQQVGSESLLDTLEDLSNYAAMTACWLKGVQAEDDVVNKSFHAVKDLIEKCDDSDVMDAYKYNIQDMQDTMKFLKKPGTPFTPLGPEIIYEPQLPEALYNYIKENVDDCVNRIHQLSLRGSVITKGGLENFTYNLGRVAMDHYEDPQKIIEHIGQIPSFGSLDDKQAQMVVESVKEYIHDFIKEKEAEPINKFVETSSQYNDVEKEIDALLQKLFRMTENRKGYFATIEYLNDWNSIIIEIANIAKTNNISDSHLMDLIFPYTRLESNTILYQVNRNKSSHNDIVVKTDNLEFKNKPVGIWKPLGSEVVHELPYIYKIGDCGMEHTDDNVSHDDAYDFLEKQINCAVGYMNHARAHGKIPLTKDIGIYIHNITQYALEQYINPHRIIQYMGQILTTRSLNPNDALLLCSSVMNTIRNITNKEKGCNRAKAKDKARANKVIVMASRGSGKAFTKARSLLKELGIPEEDIKEIFEGLEEEDDE